jgi:hypothetical protein
MIRTRIAVALLKWSGALVEFRVKRIKAKAPGKINVDGTTIFRTKKLKDALTRYAKAKTNFGQKVAVQVVARVAERHHTPNSIGAVSTESSAETPAVAASGDAEVSTENGDDNPA